MKRLSDAFKRLSKTVEQASASFKAFGDALKKVDFAPLMDAMNKHTFQPGGRPPEGPPKVISEFREPNACDRLAAVADPDIKAWVDAYDAWIASGDAAAKVQTDAWQAHRDAEEALREVPLARNPAYESPEERLRRVKKRGKIDMNWHPLMPDEEFFLPNVDSPARILPLGAV
jgi:hypothetical protein